MPMIRVDDQVYQALSNARMGDESYNDALGRLLGFAQKQSVVINGAVREMEAEEMGDETPIQDVAAAIDRFLPPHWTGGQERARQILWVVITFLKRTPRDRSIRDRYNTALKLVADQLGIRDRTVRDKCGRQLYGTGLQTARFLDALEKIEAHHATV